MRSRINANARSSKMRGGKIFVRDNVGYRSGIHMKEYKDKVPVLVIGGTAKDFLGEYMAGGIIIVLNIDKEGNDLGKIKGRFIGTGIHGGSIYIRGDVDKLSGITENIIVGQPIKLGTGDVELVAKFGGRRE